MGLQSRNCLYGWRVGRSNAIEKTCNCLPIFCFSCLPLVISARAPASLARAKKNKKATLKRNGSVRRSQIIHSSA